MGLRRLDRGYFCCLAQSWSSDASAGWIGVCMARLVLDTAADAPGGARAGGGGGMLR